jgi:transcriptional regulator with XRE-family HTH domain
MVNELTNKARKKAQIKKIKKLIIDREVSGAEIARKINVDRSMISLTITGQRKSLRVRRAIADALGVAITELWPDETRHSRER